MNIKVSGQSSKTNYRNTGSCAGAVYYDAHDLREYLGLSLELGIDSDQLQFFDMDGYTVTAAEVLDKIDRNHSGLHKDDAKFFCIMIDPSNTEIAAMGDNLADQLNNGQQYIFDIMDAYARNFHREGVSDRHDLTAFAITHLFKGEKNKEQKHWHIIVARKDASNKYKLSPLTNHRGTTKGAVKGGFDRVAFDKECERLFDERFGYERKVEESFDYCLAQKKGTPEQKAEQTQRLTEQNKPDLEAAVNAFLNKRVAQLEAEAMARAKEQEKNAFHFNFVAARANEKEKLSQPNLDLYSVIMNANDFERELLTKNKTILDPILDASGSGEIKDFCVTLAQEGRQIHASSLVSPVQLDNLLDKYRWSSKGEEVAKKFRTHFEEALTYNFTSMHQFEAIMRARGVLVRQAKLAGETKDSLVFKGLSRHDAEVTRLYGEKEVGIDAMRLVQERINQNKKENKDLSQAKVRVKNITQKLFEWSTSQRHFERMLNKKGIDVVFSRAEDNPNRLIGAVLVDNVTKNLFKIETENFAKALANGHWKAEDTSKNMKDEDIITKWQDDELTNALKNAVNLLSKGGGQSMFRDSHGNHAGKTQNQLRYEREQAEEEAAAQIYKRTH